MLYTYQFRLQPTKEQTELLTQSVGCVRKVWNLFLDSNNKHYKETKTYYSYNENSKKLTLLKQDLVYLKEAYSQALQQTLKNLDNAFQSFFKGQSQYPVFKKKFKDNAIHYPQHFKVFKDFEGKKGKIKIPKIGYVDFIQHRQIAENFVAKNLYISQKGTHWYVSIQGELKSSSPKVECKKCVALDLGIKNFWTSNEAQFVKPINAYQTNLNKLKYYQRKLGMKTKYSKSWYKTKLILARIHHKISNIRKDFNHKLSSFLIKNYDVIILEKLNIQAMLEQGFSKLNLQILDQGWGQFKTFLKYKAEWQNKKVIEVNPAYTSQTCLQCGYISKENRKTQASFVCQSCEFNCHADLNASYNILKKGLRKLNSSERAVVGATALTEATSFRAW